LFHAIVAMGLAAASAACGGQVGTHAPGDVPRDAADDAVASMNAAEDSADVADAADAAQPPDSPADVAQDAASDASDSGDDHWIPRLPVIA
jgi:hypothetical protein